jgi:hypothetical protein
MPASVVTRARSAASIMEELRKGIPLAGDRASVAAASMAVAVGALTVAVATGNPI